MANPALAFVAGLGGGYVSGQQRQQELERQARLDQMAQETHDVQMGQARRKEQEQAALSDAASTAQVQPNITNDDDGNPSSAPALRVVGPGAVQNFDDPAAAQTAAAGMNDPAARDQRIELAMARSDPGAAMTYRKNVFTLNKEQQEHARKLVDENAAETARAMVQGDPDAIREAFNKKGKFKVVGEVKVTPRERTDIPGIDGLPTNDIEATVQKPDGTTMPVKINSYDFATSLMPYHDFIAQQQKGTAGEATAEYRGQLADARTTAANAQVMAAEARAAALKANGDKLSHEERIRYTSLFSDSGRRMRDTQQTINTLQRDTLFARKAAKDPNSPEAQQLKQLQSDLDGYRSERATYQQLLAQGGPTLAAATPRAPGGKAQAMPTRKQDLKAGTVYQTTRGPATWNGTAFEQ